MVAMSESQVKSRLCKARMTKHILVIVDHSIKPHRPADCKLYRIVARRGEAQGQGGDCRFGRNAEVGLRRFHNARRPRRPCERCKARFLCGVGGVGGEGGVSALQGSTRNQDSELGQACCAAPVFGGRCGVGRIPQRGRA